MEIFLISGPSGVGKSTLIKMLMAASSQECQFSVSHTTRARRPEEIDGIHYHFVSKENFEKINFYEKLVYDGHHYGTSEAALRSIARLNKLPILDVNIKSLEQFRRHSDLVMTTVFLKPPTLQVLRDRLNQRSKSTHESKNSIENRFQKATEELSLLEKEHFDHVLVNDDLEKTFGQLKEVIKPVIERVQGVCGKCGVNGEVGREESRCKGGVEGGTYSVNGVKVGVRGLRLGEKGETRGSEAGICVRKVEKVEALGYKLEETIGIRAAGFNVAKGCGLELEQNATNRANGLGKFALELEEQKIEKSNRIQTEIFDALKESRETKVEAKAAAQANFVSKETNIFNSVENSEARHLNPASETQQENGNVAENGEEKGGLLSEVTNRLPSLKIE